MIIISGIYLYIYISEGVSKNGATLVAGWLRKIPIYNGGWVRGNPPWSSAGQTAAAFGRRRLSLNPGKPLKTTICWKPVRRGWLLKIEKVYGTPRSWMMLGDFGWFRTIFWWFRTIFDDFGLKHPRPFLAFFTSWRAQLWGVPDDSLELRDVKLWRP